MTTFAIARVSGTNGPSLAVVAQGQVLALSALWSGTECPSTMSEMLADWDRYLDVVADNLDRAKTAGWVKEQDIDFCPPVEPHTTLFCAGGNFYDHLKEMGAPEIDKTTTSPYHFVIPSTALLAHQGDVVRPPTCERLDWEVELAAVIGRRAHDVSQGHALDYVAGYTIANDLSGRDPEKLIHPVFGVDFIWSKGQKTLKPLGPVLVPARFVHDPQDLGLRLSVNGIVRQDSSTQQMIFSVEEQIAHLSAGRPLLPGDVVLTGTPAGTGAAHDLYLQPGDTVVAEIDGLGQLENKIIAPSEVAAHE